MQTRLTKYIFVDPSAQTAEMRSVRLDYQAMLGIIGCESVEAVRLPSGDVLIFDGEPVEYDGALDGVEIEGIPVLGSRCMITGPDDPKTEMPTNCRVTVSDVLAMIKWMPQRQIGGETFTKTATGGEIGYIFDPA
jgi:hypothetical protein